MIIMTLIHNLFWYNRFDVGENALILINSARILVIFLFHSRRKMPIKKQLEKMDSWIDGECEL